MSRSRATATILKLSSRNLAYFRKRRHSHPINHPDNSDSMFVRRAFIHSQRKGSRKC